MFILGVSNYDASKFCKGAYLAKTCTQCNPHDDIIELAASSNNSNKQANAAAIRGSAIFGCTPTARTMVIMPFIMLVSRSDIPTSRPSADIPSKSALQAIMAGHARRREVQSIDAVNTVRAEQAASDNQLGN